MNDIASKIVEIITRQFKSVVNNLSIKRNVEIYEERTFEFLNASQKLNKNTIYVVVHFDNATLMMGGTIYPIIINVLSSSEALQDDMNILFTYSSTFNFIPPTDTDLFIQQTYTGANVENAFEQVGGEYRSLITMNATFSVGEDILGVRTIEIDNEKVSYSNISGGVEYTQNAINTGNSNGLVRSVNKFGVNAFSLSLIALKRNYDRFFFDLLFGKVGINTQKKIKFIFNDGTEYEDKYRVINVEFKQSIGGIPNFVVSFGKA